MSQRKTHTLGGVNNGCKKRMKSVYYKVARRRKEEEVEAGCKRPWKIISLNLFGIPNSGSDWTRLGKKNCVTANSVPDGVNHYMIEAFIDLTLWY